MMRLNLKNKHISYFIIALALLLCPFAQAQQQNKFRYKADVAKVDSDGVYKIELQPNFTAKSTSRELYDIRIANEAGKFIGYTIITNPRDYLNPVFLTFPEVKQTASNDSVTTYIVDSRSIKVTNQLWLQLKNTGVSRQAGLSGSDDLNHWFAIEENIELKGSGDGSGAEFEQVLTFPKSKYRYYRLKIGNKHKDPIKIIRAGIYLLSNREPVGVMPLPQVKFHSKDGDKQTSYYVDLGDSYLVNGVFLDIASPKYFDRHISIYDIGNKPEEKLYEDSITPVNLRYSNFSAKTNRLRIDITNGDDSPLVIKNISVMELPEFAVAYLEKGHKYSLFSDDSAAHEVSYDLSFLHSKPMSKFPVIQHSAVYKNPAFGPPVIRVMRDYTQLIWIAIAVVLVVLSLLTWRMVKEVNAKQGS